MRLPNCSNLVINWKNDNDFIICLHDVIVKCFGHCFVSLVKFSYWLKFYVNIITGSGVVTTFVYNGLIRNPDIGNTSVLVLPKIWRLELVRDTNFWSDMSLMKCYWMLENARVTAFTVSELLGENQHDWGERGGYALLRPNEFRRFLWKKNQMSDSFLNRLLQTCQLWSFTVFIKISRYSTGLIFKSLGFFLIFWMFFSNLFFWNLYTSFYFIK